MMRKKLILAAAFGTMLIQIAAAGDLLNVRFQHKDWEIVCDNARTCRAAGYTAEAAEPGASVLLTRRAGPNVPLAAELQPGEPGDER